MSSDPFAHHDAAYVLGALSQEERRAFEEHVSRCTACTRAVADLAGLPALLAHVDETAFAGPDTSPPLPETLLPRLLVEVRRRRRRMRAVAVAGAVTAAAAAVAVVVGVLLAGSSPSPAPPDAQAMSQVDQERLSATVSLEGVAWGTRMRLACTYRDAGWGDAPSYALVVRTRDGETQQVATWRGVPGRVTRLEAATAADPADIASVDVVVSGTGRTVLRLAPGDA